MSESLNKFTPDEYPVDGEPLRVIEYEASGEESEADIITKLSRTVLSQTIETKPGDDIDDNDEIWVERAAGIVHSADPVKDYLRQTGREPLLNATEEVELAKAIEAGLLARGQYDIFVDDPTTSKKYLRELRELERIGDRAKDRMVNANLRLVVNIAKNYLGKGMSFLDLIQEGNLGMVHAVEKFDYAQGYKFSTYATWWIRQSIHRSIADKSREIRIPAHLNEKINGVLKLKRELLLELGREPSDEEIAEASHISVSKLYDYMRYIQNPLSLNMKIGDDQTAELGDLITDTVMQRPEDAADKIGFNRRMYELLDTLDEKSAFVLRQRMGIDTGEVVPLQEIGDQLGLSRERVRQLQMRIIAKLRSDPELMKELREYL